MTAIARSLMAATREDGQVYISRLYFSRPVMGGSALYEYLGFPYGHAKARPLPGVRCKTRSRVRQRDGNTQTRGSKRTYAPDFTLWSPNDGTVSCPFLSESTLVPDGRYPIYTHEQHCPSSYRMVTSSRHQFGVHNGVPVPNHLHTHRACA